MMQQYDWDTANEVMQSIELSFSDQQIIKAFINLMRPSREMQDHLDSLMTILPVTC